MMRVTRTTMHGAVMKLSMWGDDAPLRGARTRTQGGRTPPSAEGAQWLARRELLAADGAMGVASGAVRRRWAAPSSPSGRMYHTSSPLLTNRTPLSQEVENAKQQLTLAEATVRTCHVAVAKAKLELAGWRLLEKGEEARLNALRAQMQQLCTPHAVPGFPEWQVLETYVATAARRTESTEGEEAKIEQLENAKKELDLAETKLEKAKTELKEAKTELKEAEAKLEAAEQRAATDMSKQQKAAARSMSLEMFCESVANGSKLRHNDLFLPFDEHPNAKVLLDKISGILDLQVYRGGDYGILKKAELESPETVELCLLKETTDTDGVLLAVRAPTTDALQEWKATPPSALASLEGEWTFLRHDCLASKNLTRKDIPLLTTMAAVIAPAMMGRVLVSIRDRLDKRREEFAKTQSVVGLPTSLLDAKILSNLRPEPRKLVDMSFEIVRKGDGKDKRSETPEDIAERLAEVHAVFFSAASGSGKTAAMFALLKILEAAHRNEALTTFGLTCTMKTLALQYEGRPVVADDAAKRVASYVAERLVDELGKPPTGRGYEVKGLRVVLLVDEAGPYPEFARALAAASATRHPSGHLHATTLSDTFHEQLRLQLDAKGWQPHAGGIEKDSLRLLVVVAGTGVGRTKDGTSLPDGVLLGTFRETNPFEVMGMMVDSAFAGQRFSEEPRSIPPGTTTIDDVSLRDVVVEAVKSEETLRMFAKSNLRCAALLGELLARHCYCLPRDEVKDYVARNVLLLVSMVSTTFVRSNGWAGYPDYDERKRLAKLVLSLFATVPDGYHLLTADDLQKLVRELGAVEDCATPTGGSTCGIGNAIKGKNRDEMVPAWGTLCYPNVESTDATTPTWYLPTNRQTAKQYRLRVDPALLLVCVSILGHQIVPTTKEPSPQLYESFVFAMTEALSFAHGEAAARYFKAHGGGGEQWSVFPDVIWPWLPKGVCGAKCLVTMSATRHRVVSHEDQLEETEKDESHPESDPVRSCETISRLLGLCPPAPPTSPEAGCAMVVELAAPKAAQSDVVVHTATGSIGMECKEFVNGGPISVDMLVKRAGAMGYGAVVVELPESAYVSEQHHRETQITVTDRAVSSLLHGKKLRLTKAIQIAKNKRVRLTFSADPSSSAVVNRMLRSMLLRKAHEELPSTFAAAATVPGPAGEGTGEDVVVLVGPREGLLPEGCSVWFEDPWRLVAAPTEAGTPPTAASTQRWKFHADWCDKMIRKFPLGASTTTITITENFVTLSWGATEGTAMLVKAYEKDSHNRCRANVVSTQLSLLDFARRLVDE